MLPAIIDFANVVLAALLVGSIFGVWMVLNPSGLDASSYIAVQQQGIRTVNKKMPVLGAITILTTAGAAWFARGESVRFGLLLATALCFVAVGLITRFRNQPINAIVMTWKSDSVPANWMKLRDQWWRWHLVRLAAGMAGLCMLVAAALRRA